MVVCNNQLEIIRIHDFNKIYALIICLYCIDISLHHPCLIKEKQFKYSKY